MTKKNPEYEQAVKNLETFKRLLTDKTGPRGLTLIDLTMELELALISAPASTRREYHGAFAGGLVEHLLTVVSLMATLNKAYETKLSAESIVLVGLFHDIGKCGNGKQEYYVPKTSDWHNKQGIYYEINPELELNMPVHMRSLFLLQNAGVSLTEHEYFAISSVRDRLRPGEESLPTVNEPMLSVILQQAVKVASLKGSNRTSLLA